MKDPASRREVISRYEAKYLVSEAMASAIKEHIRGICSPDRHVGRDGRYVVNNLYFDTPDLRFYHDTLFKQYRRFKPRVRFYGEGPMDWLWLELKHKVRNVTWKVRRRVDAHELPCLLDARKTGAVPVFRVPILPGALAVSLSDSFEDVVERFGASAILQVQYVREPLVSELDEYARVTFDRHLTCRSLDGPDSLVAGVSFVPFDDPVTVASASGRSPVILEIKTDVQIPGWVAGLVRSFGLERCGFSKYCRALERARSEEVACDRVAAEPIRRAQEAVVAGSVAWAWRRGIRGVRANRTQEGGG